ncbi:MAG: bifunctional nuclease family protein [Actinobacteria bacterium]|nr:bifunctional nuclease family protein [Actinomycetota bacterium]NBR92113.1 bifunctional nuclease family protein [Actinomycetota bacterium]NBY57218.1 bifunctional nuclease family protein [Actinomycetota bacterium]
MRDNDSVTLDLVGVRVDPPAQQPVMQLREQHGDRRMLGIYIGAAEASAIGLALEGRKPPRPLTHDLIVNLFENFGAHLSRVVITEMRAHTYFAELHLVHQGQTHVISCRPSDAVAIAVRADVPIAATRELIDEVGVMVDEEGDEESEEIMDEFRDFIENISPEDFQEK